jgi:hypothetical protein
MNRQPNLNNNTARNLTHTASSLSAKEITMNRRITTVLFALVATFVLTACAVPSPFQTTGSVTVLPKEAASPINDRHQLAEYQASLPLYVALPVAKASGLQINDRQQLAEYQASLPAYVALPVSAKPAVKDSGLQINDRQQLAEYQASLPAYVALPVPAKPVTSGLQINDRQQLAEYQASLPLYVGKITASVTEVQPTTDRQWLADYQATLR